MPGAARRAGRGHRAPRSVARARRPLPGRRGLIGGGARGRCGSGSRCRRFATTPPALDAARRAEELGLDGVFVFDHLWPLGAPERPALSAFPVLGAVAAATEPGAASGPLVARIGLVPDEVLVAELLSLHRHGPGSAHRRAGHRRQQERGGEPRLRDPLRPARRAPAGAAPVRAAHARRRVSRCGWAAGRRPPPSSPSTSAPARR